LIDHRSVSAARSPFERSQRIENRSAGGSAAWRQIGGWTQCPSRCADCQVESHDSEQPRREQRVRGARGVERPRPARWIRRIDRSTSELAGLRALPLPAAIGSHRVERHLPRVDRRKRSCRSSSAASARGADAATSIWLLAQVDCPPGRCCARSTRASRRRPSPSEFHEQRARATDRLGGSLSACASSHRPSAPATTPGCRDCSRHDRGLALRSPSLLALSLPDFPVTALFPLLGLLRQHRTDRCADRRGALPGSADGSGLRRSRAASLSMCCSA